jgi:transcriptional regulator with XRE-family HTH domain
MTMKINDLITIERKKKKLTQAQMAEMLGIEPSTYSRIESGDTELTIDRLAKITSILELDLLELIQKSDTVTITGNKNKVISKKQNSIGDCERDKEYLMQIIKEKDKIIEEKERIIQILMNKQP